jgi:septal ring factor EnvC (AmiA/AmiB activator)
MGVVWAGEVADNSAKLEQLRHQINELRADLDSDKQRKQSLQDQLRNVERRVGKVSHLLKRLKRQIRNKNRELGKLQAERRDKQDDLQGHRVAFAHQIRASYTAGQQEYLKILLNQQKPAAVARTLTYYDYYHRARLQRIQAIDQSLAELAEVEASLKQKKQELEASQQEQKTEKARLEGTRQERGEILAKLQKAIRSKGQRLELMLEDERRLQQLLQSLAAVPAEPPAEFGEGQPFAQRRGQLQWPTSGRVSERFGKRRKEGKLKWQGVMIDAPEGTEVRAISHGRVAFSDWLRGFGLLTIIDHGDGYMSLYGGNQSLFKEVGDWVDEGEIIASVGNSGGRKDTALYFEIRHNGKPTNPLKWCRGMPKKVARR